MPGYHLPYFTAAANGLYAAHGLDVEIVDPEPGPENTRAVALGTYDACLTSVAYFLRAKAADPALPAKFVFMVARRTHMAAFCAGDRPTAAGALTVTRRRPQIGLPLLESRFPSVDAHRALAGWEAGTPLVFGDDADADELGRMDAETWERTIRHHVDTQAIPPLPVESLFEVVAATAIARSPA